MNVISITGRLVRDPETKSLPTTSITEFSVAVNGRKKDDAATFFRCKAFGNQGEVIAKYITKGQEIAVTGRMEQRKYEKDGQSRESWELIVNDFSFIGGVRDDAKPKTTKEDDDGFDPFE